MGKTAEMDCGKRRKRQRMRSRGRPSLPIRFMDGLSTLAGSVSPNYRNSRLLHAYKSCQRHLEDVLRSGRPRRLLDSIERGLADARNGAKAEGISRSSPLKVECQQCPAEGPTSIARAYLESPPPRVVLCANRLRSRQEIEEGLVHEFVHAYDYLVSGLKLTDCRPLAYSEVRAAKSAECAETFDFFSFEYFKKRCTRATAAVSTDGLFPGKGGECVDAVFRAAYADEGPSDEL